MQQAAPLPAVLLCSWLQGPASNYAYFTACLQRNLRVAVSLDPGNEAFSRRLEQNPALGSCCSMLWWQGWSESSLRAMAHARLKVCVVSTCGRQGGSSMSFQQVLFMPDLT